MARITAESIMRQLAQPGLLVISIGARDSAWDPMSTLRQIPGPATLAYRRGAGGAITVRVGEAPQVGPRPPLKIRNTAPQSH